jgi:hypothetical protein
MREVNPTTPSNGSLPERFVAGHVLSEADVDQLRSLVAERDERIRDLQPALRNSDSRPLDSLQAPDLDTPSRELAFGSAVLRQEQLRQISAQMILWTTVFARAAALFARTPVWLIAGLLLLAPVALNPGYFNHDEMQWLVMADTGSWSTIPWSQWFDVKPFQYRPLTFNLWLLLSRTVGYTPIAFHSIVALFGLANAFALRTLLQRLHASPLTASAASLLFLYTPYVMFVHAWVGTLADILVLGFSLLALLRICGVAASRALTVDTLIVAMCTAAALLSKESAVVFPVLFLGIGWTVRGRRIWPIVLASAAVVAVYLAFRLNIILFAPRTGDAYSWSLLNIPIHLRDTALFPFLVHYTEMINVTDAPGASQAFAIVCLGALLYLISRAGWRWVLALIIGWMVCLGPTMILHMDSNVYVYLASAFACGLVALAAAHLSIVNRIVLTLLCGVLVVHGMQVVRDMRHYGRVQYHLFADLERLLPGASANDPLRIRAERPGDTFMPQRLTFWTSHYRRIPMGERLVVLTPEEIAQGAPFNVVMDHSGNLSPAPAATSR